MEAIAADVRRRRATLDESLNHAFDALFDEDRVRASARRTAADVLGLADPDAEAIPDPYEDLLEERAATAEQYRDELTAILERSK